MTCKVCATIRKLSDRLAAYRERKAVERVEAAARDRKRMELRSLATRLWMDDGGRGGVHGFMVSYPPTREKYEADARVILRSQSRNG